MITLQSRVLRAGIMRRGATLSGLWHKGSDRSLVLGAPDPSLYGGALLYAGAIVGPLANRIAGARVTIDGRAWQLSANEGKNCLHNGPEGLHALDWDVAEQTAATVTLTLDLAHGATGLPGRRQITARYVLSDDGTLTLTIRAQTDRPTLMNPAHHPYWTLDADGLDRHSLQVRAAHYLETDDQSLPTGRVLPVAGTGLDFREPRSVSVADTIDACLCPGGQTAAPRPVARLTGGSGLGLELETTAPGLQVYNAAGLPASDVPLHPGQKMGPFAGIALEPQGWPDAPNHADFLSVVLMPDVPFAQQTIYRILR